MNIEHLQDLCNKLPGVTEDVKWGHDLCFCVAEKMFLVAALDQHPISASFKVSDEEFDTMITKPGFKPAPYMAKHKWVWVEDINLVGKKEWTHYINQSYQLVKSKLPKRTQASLTNKTSHK